MPLKGVGHVKDKTSSSFSLHIVHVAPLISSNLPPPLLPLMMPNLNMKLSAFGGFES